MQILYTIYSPAEHNGSTVHQTKEEGDELEESGKDEAPEWSQRSKAQNKEAGEHPWCAIYENRASTAWQLMADFSNNVWQVNPNSTSPYDYISNIDSEEKRLSKMAQLWLSTVLSGVKLLCLYSRHGVVGKSKTSLHIYKNDTIFVYSCEWSRFHRHWTIANIILKKIYYWSNR